MTYDEILKMVRDAVDKQWFFGSNCEDLKKVILKCTTDIYIEQMREGKQENE